MSSIGVNFERLRKSVEWSIRQLETPRKKRVEAVKQFVGMHYAENGSDKRVPTNFIELAVTVYVRMLAARAPKVLVSTDIQKLRPYAKDMEIALNQIPGEIGLGKTLQRSVVEAMFSLAVVKVGLGATGKEEFGVEYGQPFVDLLSIDDYFFDMSAKTRDSIQYEGNDYWLNVEDARRVFGIEDIEADEHTTDGPEGQERAESVSTDSCGDIYGDRVWMRDVYLPRLNKMVSYGVKSNRVFKVVDWDGPISGPYHTLSFSDVPGNILPLPPVALWIDMHELGNGLFRKLGKQASAKKTVAAFQGGNDEDVERLKNAQDGDGIRYNGQKPENITVGGIDAPTLAFYIQIKDLFSYFAGNLDTLGGLSPMSDTVGQDRLLSEAASARVKQMGERTVDFVKEIFRSLAWYEWTDPIRQRSIVKKPAENAPVGIAKKWSMEERDGDFIDYNFDIDVYSMQDDSPSTKMQKLGTALERFVFPIMSQFAEQGGRVNLQKLNSHIAKLANVPELEDIVEFVQPEATPQPGAAAGAAGAPAPAHTTRTYERVNRPGATRHGKDDVMTRLLLGGKVQNLEAAAVGRSVS